MKKKYLASTNLIFIVKYLYKKTSKNIRLVLIYLKNILPKHRVPSYKIIRNILKKVPKSRRKKATDLIIRYIQRSTISYFGFNSSRDLSEEILKHFSTSISDSNIRRIRKRLGFVSRRTRKSPLLNDFHRLQRYVWCRNNENNDFYNYVFVNETTIRAMEIPLYHIRYPGSSPAAFPCSSKMGFKVNLWGGISMKGATPFVPFSTNLDKNLYKEIIEYYLYPFVAEKYNYSVHLHQDNDPKHTSALCMASLVDCGIYWIRSPPFSPDLNPIEWVWSDLKSYVRKQRCKSRNEIITAVQNFYEKITPEYCKNYNLKLKKVIKIVIERKGGWSDS